GLGTPNGIAAFQASASVSLSVSPSSAAAGSAVLVAWSGLTSPTATDWLGLYRAGAADTDLLGWVYVSCSATPSVARACGACSARVPTSVATGAYEVRLFANDGYTRLASTPLNVAGSSQGGSATTTAKQSGITRRGGQVLEAHP